MRCFYCDCDCDPRSRTTAPTRDHIYPKRATRPFHRLLKNEFFRLNLVECCASCNGAKGDMSPFEWLTRLQPSAAMRLAERLRAMGNPHLEIALAATLAFSADI